MLNRFTLHPRTLVVVLAVGLLAGVAASLLVAASREPVSVATATATASPTSTVSPSPRPTSRPTPRRTPAPTPIPTPTPTPTPELSVDDRNVTILLVGRDFLASRLAHGESGMNTDMLIVANVRADGSRIDLMSLPRDSVDIPLGDGTVWGEKVNALRAALGLPALKQAMSAVIGQPIDYYAEMTLDDLSRLVDAAGGVTVWLAAPLHDPHLGYSWPAGASTLNGSTAVLFARSRFADSDYARGERNQVLMLAVRDRLLAGGYDPVSLLTALPGLDTDIPASDMPGLLQLARDSANATVVRQVFGPEYASFVGIAGARGWISVPNYGAIQAYVADAFTD